MLGCAETGQEHYPGMKVQSQLHSKHSCWRRQTSGVSLSINVDTKY